MYFNHYDTINVLSLSLSLSLSDDPEFWDRVLSSQSTNNLTKDTSLPNDNVHKPKRLRVS